eukprot:6175257-Pleurochrysis_carterae.AAC.2
MLARSLLRGLVHTLVRKASLSGTHCAFACTPKSFARESDRKEQKSGSALGAEARNAELLLCTLLIGERLPLTVRSATGVLLRSGSSSVSRDSSCVVSAGGVERPSVAELGGAISVRRNVLRSSHDKAGGGEEEALGTSRVTREATACAMSMFRSGGYAACEADCQPFSLRAPPTLDACVRCVQVSVDNRLSAGCRPGVHMNVVYFCPGAPSAH